jgi:hypothetical protein
MFLIFAILFAIATFINVKQALTPDFIEDLLKFTEMRSARRGQPPITDHLRPFMSNFAMTLKLIKASAYGVIAVYAFHLFQLSSAAG